MIDKIDNPFLLPGSIYRVITLHTSLMELILDQTPPARKSEIAPIGILKVVDKECMEGIVRKRGNLWQIFLPATPRRANIYLGPYKTEEKAREEFDRRGLVEPVYIKHRSACR